MWKLQTCSIYYDNCSQVSAVCKGTNILYILYIIAVFWKRHNTSNELCRVRLWKKSHAFKLCLNSTCFLFLHDIIPNYNYYYIPLEEEKNLQI